MPTASIIIPAHNKATTLGAVLNSLACQSAALEAIEVIVVDDASSDGCGELADSMSVPYSRRVVRLDKGSGGCLSVVRNAGLREARGDIVVFLDADVVAGPDFVRGHLEGHAHAGTHSVIIGYVHGYSFFPEGRTPEILRPPPVERVLSELPTLMARDPRGWRDGRETDYRRWRDFSRCPIPWFFSWGCNFSCGRSDALAVDGFDEGFRGWGAEDLEFAYRLFKQGARFKIAREAWGVHYPHAVSSTNEVAHSQNVIYFAKKHADPLVEFFHFSSKTIRDPHAFRARWDLLDFIYGHPRFAPPTSAECEDLLVQLASESGREPMAWFGAMPADPPKALHQVFHTDPFGRDDGRLPHYIGMACPFEDSTWNTAVIVDYWRCLPPSTWPYFCREMLRLAFKVVLFSSGSDPQLPTSLLVRSLDDCRAILESSVADISLKTIDGGRGLQLTRS